MKRKYKYSFVKKEDTEDGFASVVYAGISLVIFIIAACISFLFEGNAGSWIGVLGLMAVLFSVVGFLTGLKSFKERDKNYRFSAIGSLANGVILVGWLALFLIGI